MNDRDLAERAFALATANNLLLNAIIAALPAKALVSMRAYHLLAGEAQQAAPLPSGTPDAVRDLLRELLQQQDEAIHKALEQDLARTTDQK